jgi:putative transposase
MLGKNTPKAVLARSLGLSRNTLYYVPKRPYKDAVLKDKILSVLEEHPAYGYRRIALHLKINKKQVQRVKQKYGIKPTILRKQPKYGKNKSHAGVPNRIKSLCPIAPDVFWSGDFTYLWYHGRYIYLATVIDNYTREIVAWQIGLHHTARLVVDVLEEALRKREHTPEIFHSDQGSEYASDICMSWLAKHAILPSHSPKGKPWHNGRQESFFSYFKLEFGNVSSHSTIEKLIEAIGKHIHYYNTKRIHSKLKMPPREFCKKEKKLWKRASLGKKKENTRD